MTCYRPYCVSTANESAVEARFASPPCNAVRIAAAKSATFILSCTLASIDGSFSNSARARIVLPCSTTANARVLYRSCGASNFF